MEPLESVLVANRGEIALRVIRTVRRLGLRAIAVHSVADTALPFVRAADEAVLIGPAPAADSYLNADALLAAARRSGASAIHPGYGFLSESAPFAAQVTDAGLRWIGPPSEVIEAMGDKINARNLMEQAGVPVAAGSRVPLADVEAAAAEAASIGYPVMIKAAAGGGGIGMSVARDEGQLRAGFATARSRAERFFANPAILLERYTAHARHVEVQILGLPGGRIISFPERDCSVQRRHQKLAEETTSPGVSPELRTALASAAEVAGRTVGYLGAGTVEFLLDTDTQQFVFLEMNTRLQVEHPVTEMITGIDLVEQQIRIAAGEQSTAQVVMQNGHAVELRVYAEDHQRFLPSPGVITEWAEPTGPGVRVDAGYAAGCTVTPHYDPLLAKLCAWGADRREALDRAADAVAAFRVEGLRTNLAFHADLLKSPEFASGRYDTSLVGRLRPGAVGG